MALKPHHLYRDLLVQKVQVHRTINVTVEQDNCALNSAPTAVLETRYNRGVQLAARDPF